MQLTRYRIFFKMVIFFEISMDIGWTKNGKFENSKRWFFTYIYIFEYDIFQKSTGRKLKVYAETGEMEVNQNFLHIFFHRE